MSSIVTFYSYKGGVGRSMAMANIAFELAKKRMKILIVDWDLEAPGLEKYFSKYQIEESKAGLLSLLMEVKQEFRPQYQDYVSKIRIDPDTNISLLTSGREQDSNYSANLEKFDWEVFFSKESGGGFLESLRNHWKKDFDFVLIDSRTGLNDSSGICTILLPDIIIPMFTANYQSLYGVRDIMRLAKSARLKLSNDRMALTIFPVPCRFAARAEFKESQEWLDRFSKELEEFYFNWLPKDINPKIVLEKVKIPQIDYFSFGEKLAVAEHGTSDPEGMGYIYSKIASLLASDFQDLESFLGKEYLIKKAEFEKKANLKSASNQQEIKGFEYDLFISYANDSITRQWIIEMFLPQLTQYLAFFLGYEPKIFIDVREISSSELIVDTVQNGLRNSKILLPIITPKYFQNTYTLVEWRAFVEKTKWTNLDIVFPILLTEIDLIKNSSLLTKEAATDMSYLFKKAYLNFSEFRSLGKDKSGRDDIEFVRAIDNMSKILSESIKAIDRTYQSGFGIDLQNENKQSDTLKGQRKKKVFVSYDHSEDVHYKELLRAWDANSDFDFEFDLRSPNVAIDSTDASIIQTSLTKKIKESGYVLVIIGKKSYSSKWMKWEIERAKQKDTNLKFAAVKISSDNRNPPGLPPNAAVANGFTLKGIVNALNQANNFY